MRGTLQRSSVSSLMSKKEKSGSTGSLPTRQHDLVLPNGTDLRQSFASSLRLLKNGRSTIVTPNLSALHHRIRDLFELELERRSIHPSLRVPVWRLKNLDHTIDQLFAVLSEENCPELLNPLCPFFGVPWPAGKAMAGWLFEQGRKGLLTRGGVIELGCGLALPSLVASYLLNRPVLATDFHPAVPWFLEKNCDAWDAEFPPLIDSNRGLSRRNLRFQPGAWQEREATLAGIQQWMKTDLQKAPIAAILGSDILYEAQAAIELAELLPVLQAACETHGSQRPAIWIADPGRPYLQVFIDAMKSRGYPEPRTEIIFGEDHSADHPKKEIFLIQFP